MPFCVIGNTHDTYWVSEKITNGQWSPNSRVKGGWLTLYVFFYFFFIVVSVISFINTKLYVFGGEHGGNTASGARTKHDWWMPPSSSLSVGRPSDSLDQLQLVIVLFFYRYSEAGYKVQWNGVPVYTYNIIRTREMPSSMGGEMYHHNTQSSSSGWGNGDVQFEPTGVKKNKQENYDWGNRKKKFINTCRWRQSMRRSVCNK